MMHFVDVGRFYFSHQKNQPQRRATPRQRTQTVGFLMSLFRRSRSRSVRKTATNFLSKCWGLRERINRMNRCLVTSRVGKFFRFLWDSKFVITWDRGFYFSVRWAK